LMQGEADELVESLVKFDRDERLNAGDV
jgi:hypothetical protein